MLIIPLVENTKDNNKILKNEKGLSLYIETGVVKIIFDLGSTDIFKTNANIIGIKLENIDHFIISHGHSDHIGGYNFLEKSEKRKN
ncbi:MAG: MBL fold metallo-hydrolase [Cetobacterium sp.]